MTEIERLQKQIKLLELSQFALLRKVKKLQEVNKSRMHRLREVKRELALIKSGMGKYINAN